MCNAPLTRSFILCFLTGLVKHKTYNLSILKLIKQIMEWTSMFSDPPKQETVSTSIPKKIHFVWVGSDIPGQYLNHIAQYRTLARQSGFEVNIWTDKSAHIVNPARAIELNLADLHLRDIRTLDPSNTELWRCIDKESVGAHNYAAAADILRLMVLKEEGGYYFDVDLIPKLEVQEHDPLADFDEDIVDSPRDRVATPIVEKFVIPDAPYGFLCYCEEWGMQDSRQKDDDPLKIRKLSNHALASSKNHPIVNLALKRIPENYKNNDTLLFRTVLFKTKDENKALLHTVSRTDLKRNRNLAIYRGGRQLTIDASGPSVIKGAISTFVKDKDIKDFSGFSFPLIARGDNAIIVMPNAISHCENNWFGSGDKKAHEFEDLPSITPKPFRPSI